MDESPERRDDAADVASTEATDERGDAPPGPGPQDRTPDSSEMLNAPKSAGEGGHTLLEEYERENASPWRGRLRTAAFWVGATAVAVAVTLTAVVSLRRSGLSDGLAFVLGSVGMAIVVGFVFLSVRR
ncbi:hypothetical protein BRC89_08170 [Halobacteriales archaeon QS_4_70_19]|nr:MAG: hypothetical protein BRC89_08170 [Halobacteriales archaeon QS_4_70_19]